VKKALKKSWRGKVAKTQVRIKFIAQAGVFNSYV
jgi:hypothetical protein